MKLHLGCGQRYFEGYVNVDYPSSEHSVQQTSVADEYANLLELRYKSESIAEVRLHHVFEHFSRATSLALLYSWNTWLKRDGVLHIEVPDFEKTGKVALSRFSSKKAKAVAMRHIFGSQEAHWAVHFEGYTMNSLKNLMHLYGFQAIEKKRNDHLGTYNIEIIAKKIKHLTPSEATAITRNYLQEYMVADVDSEKLMLDTWMVDYEKQVKQTVATP
ncbi:MAG TPA: hypothetical protein VFF27_13690 [Bacteroidia bacterium]|jgi:predicted SAM-dependent methyltransferase|nr:hypothetical protein [Bacteroidia bacterium]